MASLAFKRYAAKKQLLFCGVEILVASATCLIPSTVLNNITTGSKLEWENARLLNN